MNDTTGRVFACLLVRRETGNNNKKKPKEREFSAESYVSRVGADVGGGVDLREVGLAYCR